MRLLPGYQSLSRDGNAVGWVKDTEETRVGRRRKAEQSRSARPRDGATDGQSEQSWRFPLFHLNEATIDLVNITGR